MKLPQPWTVAAICFTIAATIQVFNLGRMYQDHTLRKKVDKCADDLYRQTERDPDHMKKFYGHKKGEMGNVYNHADAITELEWARCFRKELNK